MSKLKWRRIDVKTFCCWNMLLKYFSLLTRSSFWSYLYITCPMYRRRDCWYVSLWLFNWFYTRVWTAVTRWCSLKAFQSRALRWKCLHCESHFEILEKPTTCQGSFIYWLCLKPNVLPLSPGSMASIEMFCTLTKEQSLTCFFFCFFFAVKKQNNTKHNQ